MEATRERERARERERETERERAKARAKVRAKVVAGVRRARGRNGVTAGNCLAKLYCPQLLQVTKGLPLSSFALEVEPELHSLSADPTGTHLLAISSSNQKRLASSAFCNRSSSEKFDPTSTFPSASEACAIASMKSASSIPFIASNILGTQRSTKSQLRTVGIAR